MKRVLGPFLTLKAWPHRLLWERVLKISAWSFRLKATYLKLTEGFQSKAPHVFHQATARMRASEQ